MQITSSLVRFEISALFNFSLMTLVLLVTLCGMSLFAFRLGYWPFVVATTISVAIVTVRLFGGGGTSITFWSCAIGATGGVVGSVIAMLADNYLRERPPVFVTNFEYQSMFVRSIATASITWIVAAIVGAIVAMLINYGGGDTSTSNA